MPIDVVQWRVRIGLFHSEGAYREMRRRCGRKHQKIKIKSLVGDVSFVVAVVLLAIELVRAMMLHSITVLSRLQWKDVTEFFHTTLSSLYSQWQQQDDKPSVSRKSTRRSRPNLITDLPSLTAVCVVVLHSVVRMLLLLSGDVERNPGPQVLLTPSNANEIGGVLKQAEFLPSDWESLASQLRIADRERIKQKYQDPTLCMEETIRQWLHNEMPNVSWEELATAVSKVDGYGEGTKRTILRLAERAAKDNLPQSPTVSTDGESPHGASATGNERSRSPDDVTDDERTSPHTDSSRLSYGQTRDETASEHSVSTLNPERDTDVKDQSGAGDEGQRLMISVTECKAWIIKLRKKLQNLVGRTLQVMKDKNVDLSDACLAITDLPMSLRDESRKSLKATIPDLAKATSLNELFYYLNSSYCWNYLNFDLLWNIIDFYGDDETKQTMREYDSEVKEFRKRTLVRVFWEANDRKPIIHPEEIPPNVKEYVVKRDWSPDSRTLEDVEKLREETACELCLPMLAIRVYIARPNTVEITFLVPLFALEDRECVAVPTGGTQEITEHLQEEVRQLELAPKPLSPEEELPVLKHGRDDASQPLQPRPLPLWNTADTSRSDFWYNEYGHLLTENECIVIAMCDVSGPQVKAVKKRSIKPDLSYEEGMHQDVEHVQRQIRQDRHKELICTYSSFQSQSKTEYLQKIESFLMNCKKPGALIWYTGDGQQDTGNWCFSDDVITLDEIWELYLTCFRGRLLYIVSDCCYSGQWVLRLAEILDSVNISACGHKAREKGILFKVFCSCHPHELAYSTCFSTHGILIDNNDGRIWFPRMIQLPPDLDQTTCGLDATRVRCSRTPEESCLFSNPQFPTDLQWSWKDLVHPEELPTIHIVRGMDQGRPDWHYVLVYKHSLEQFLVKTTPPAAGTMTYNVGDYGHILYSGWGKDPPQEIKKKISNYSPGRLASQFSSRYRTQEVVPSFSTPKTAKKKI